MIGVLLSVAGTVMSVMGLAGAMAAPSPPDALAVVGEEPEAPEGEKPAAAPPANEGAEESAPAASEEPEGPRPIETVDDLLLALEGAGKDLRSLTAGVMYTNMLALEGDVQTRTGDLYFIALDGEQGLSRRFAVYWNSLRVDDRLDRDVKEAIIFDGEWLVRKNESEKQFIKQQVVRPGEKFDPLALGEGPFPIPIGQTRQDILDRFEATMPTVEDGLTDAQLLAVVGSKPTFQLKLVPRTDVAEEMRLTEIRIWYRAGTLLPVMAWTQTAEGNESTVVLMSVKTNEPIEASKLDTTTPERGWNVEVTAFAEEER